MTHEHQNYDLRESSRSLAAQANRDQSICPPRPPLLEGAGKLTIGTREGLPCAHWKGKDVWAS